MAKQILVETVDGVRRTWFDVGGKEFAAIAAGMLLDSDGRPIAHLDGEMYPCRGPSVIYDTEAIRIAAEIRAALDDRVGASLRADFIENKMQPIQPNCKIMEHAWYSVDGVRYAVAYDEFGDSGHLIDNDGTVLAYLDPYGYVSHPAQLRYNAIFCDPAARQRAKDRFEAIAAAIRECDEELLGYEQNRSHNANA
jgi:hypothetical protein